MNPQSHDFITKDGSSIHYVTAGTGFPIVFLHGNNSNYHYFAHQIRFFSERYAVIAMDSRAQGLSTNRAEKLNFSLMAEDLAEVLAHEKINRALIVGFSDGANLALVFAKLYPAQVAGLVLNAGNQVPYGLTPFWHFITDVQMFGARFLSHFLKKWKKILNIYQLMEQPIPITREEIEKITAPTLIIQGQFDVVTVQHAKKLQRLIKGSSLIIIPGATHSFAHKQPDIFNPVLNHFILEKVVS